MADSNRTTLRYQEEGSGTWNTAMTANMKTVRMTGESIVPEVENIVSNELRSDRMISDLIQVSRQNSGGFEFELSYASFDDLLEGALFDSWDGDVLVQAVERHSYTIEKAHLDIDEYFLFTGMMVNAFNLSLSTGAIATGSFDFLGSGATLLQATNATTLTAANSNTIMNCMGNVATLLEATYGGTLTALTGVYVQELSFAIANNLRPVMAIGSDVMMEIAVGKADITGTLNAYFTTDRLFDKFLAGTAIALQFSITDGTNTYTILIPKVKFETESIPASGQDTDVVENLTWRAIRDSVTNTMIQITRVTG
jgi:hypothetical protein